jgi:FKBP-type peptidyl-prolyl cis-trans isomerase
MKQIAAAFFFLLSCVLWGGEPVAIRVDYSEDYAILDQFFKMTLFLEEYGYVLEGSKPVSFRNFCSLDGFGVTGDFENTAKEFEHSLLIRKALHVWNRLCSHQKNFALKAVALKNPESIAPAIEVQFINISKLREVIDKNIDLFHYILGSTVTTEQMVDKIAYSDELLIESLQYNLTLVGIVLGFGSHNSVVGGRIEMISALSISKDVAPFALQSALMQSKEEHSLDFLKPGCYGGYYLELAGGDDTNFRNDLPLLRPSLGFANLEEEVLAIDAMFEPVPPSLWERPRFVFGAFKGGSPNEPLIEQLQQTQQRILILLERHDCLEQVLEKIGGKKPIIACGKTAPSGGLSHLDAEKWSQILWSVSSRFENETERSAFREAFEHPTRVSKDASVMIGGSKAMLRGLKRALSNLQEAEFQFKTLAKKASTNKSLQIIVPERLYFKTTHSGSGKELKRLDRVRIGYVIEDREQNVLFANCDTWLCLSQTIPGFAHGMQGMRIGEKRTIFVHPVLGYGAATTLPPCIGLTIKVHLLDVGEGSSLPLPALNPLILDWIQSKGLYRSIEESIRRQPQLIGSFYSALLDKMGGPDKTALMSELNGNLKGKEGPNFKLCTY